ncbi:hypothetical protein HUN01_26225 [Nostoc edaphicum CCNP1411]|uniref:Uncharacterized protein n=1 Tax=Nostoc edaphicum CCNP1411 TaxID=1472755 RepID=A0A7D7LFK8_9NOSO|nr:hypothetical protein [Nostoc edaphicum]QMS90908.1 hypothetical protein HUN01_26225 [Nostoc edaphicum CCNP1411]
MRKLTTVFPLVPDSPCPLPNAQCPMPNAQCPMPNAQCPNILYQFQYEG